MICSSIFLNWTYLGHCRTKWNSSSICWVVQDSHNLSCLFLYWYLPISTFKQCEESLIRIICFLILFCIGFLKYGCIIPKSWFTKCLYKKHLLEFSKKEWHSWICISHILLLYTVKNSGTFMNSCLIQNSPKPSENNSRFASRAQIYRPIDWCKRTAPPPF